MDSEYMSYDDVLHLRAQIEDLENEPQTPRIKREIAQIKAVLFNNGY